MVWFFLGIATRIAYENRFSLFDTVAVASYNDFEGSICITVMLVYFIGFKILALFTCL